MRNEDKTTDKQGRPYAKLSTLKRHDIVIVDDGFTCMTAWSEKEVEEDNWGLYIPCEDMGHGLDGQLAQDGDTLIGIYHKKDFVR